MQRNRLLLGVMLLALLSLPLAIGASRAAAAPARASPVYNDATQARLRLSQCVFGGPDVDVYINGQLGVNGGVPMHNLGALNWTGYLYLAPGTYSVALVPTGQSLAQAYLGPVNVAVSAGHRYSLVALGQKEEASHQPLLVDETAAYQAIGVAPTDAAHISINNIKGAADLHFTAGGLDPEGGVPYGGYKAGKWVLGPFTGITVTASSAVSDAMRNLGDPNLVAFNWPAVDWLDCFAGSYPGNNDTHTAPSTSALDSLAFLQTLTAFSPQTKSVAGAAGQAPSYSIFLDALKRTGLNNLLSSGAPYMFFPPSDDAFAALPDEQRGALLNDSQALGAVLRNLIVAGYYPPGSLSGGTGGRSSRMVTNLLGQPLALASTANGFTLNGVSVGGDDYVMVANGSRVFTGINKVLLPAPPPGMPTTGVGGGGANLLDLLAVALGVLLVGGVLRRWGARR
jgi:uncharacterized surface protein with fasciclin (FAS1) repeats